MKFVGRITMDISPPNIFRLHSSEGFPEDRLLQQCAMGANGLRWTSIPLIWGGGANIAVVWTNSAVASVRGQLNSRRGGIISTALNCFDWFSHKRILLRKYLRKYQYGFIYRLPFRYLAEFFIYLKVTSKGILTSRQYLQWTSMHNRVKTRVFLKCDVLKSDTSF